MTRLPAKSAKEDLNWDAFIEGIRSQVAEVRVERGEFQRSVADLRRSLDAMAKRIRAVDDDGLAMVAQKLYIASRDLDPMDPSTTSFLNVIEELDRLYQQTVDNPFTRTAKLRLAAAWGPVILP